MSRTDGEKTMKKRKDGRYLKVMKINKKTIYFYSSEPTEKKAIRDIERQMLKYREKEEKGKKFSFVADEWEEIHYPAVEYQTEARYKTFVKHLNNFFNDTDIKQITYEDISEFLQNFVLKGYSNKTIKDQTAIVKMIFSYAYIKKYIDSDPTQYIKPPKGKPPVKREALTDEETEIINSSINCTFGFFAYFLLYTGLRKGEALALRYGDIDFKNNFINVDKSVYYVGNSPHIKQPKTESGIRKVILLDCVKNKLPKNKNKDELIFSFDGKIMRGSMFTRKWNKYLEESGLKNITAHNLRHTFATFLFEAGLECKDTQSIMGHKDISTTQNIYTHIRERRAIESSQKLNLYFNKNG